MNTFRTCIPKINFPFKISHQSSIMCIGSCFTENIGRFLIDSKFNTLINPFGIVYNPISICHIIDRIIAQKQILETDLIFMNNRYYHWDFHGDYSSPSTIDCLELLNIQQKTALDHIKTVDVLFITLGTANAFRHINKSRIVANCHKVPNQNFERIELSIETILQELEKTISALKNYNSNIKIVFTVSPVRHLRDGLIDNQLSKSKLILSAHHLAKKIDYVYYFPSYELVMDDLRDYRFYENDMIHVNQTGLQYVWEHFKKSFFDNNTMKLIDTVTKLNKDLSHRAFYPESAEHQSFITQLKKKIETLTAKHPDLEYTSEIKSLEKQLISL